MSSDQGCRQCHTVGWQVTVLVALALSTPACGSSLAKQQQARNEMRQEFASSELVRKGDACASIGDVTRAEQYYVAALRAGGPEKPIVQRLLRVCVADQRYPVAAEYVDQYLERHPRDLDFEFAAATLHAAVGDKPRARELLQSVLQREPSRAEAHFALASLLRDDPETETLADEHDLAYLRLAPEGVLAQRARARVRRNP